MPAPSRRDLLRWGLLIEGGLVLLALLGAWLFRVDLSCVSWTPAAVLWGVGGILPMLGVYRVSGELRDRVVELLGPTLIRCRWYDLLLLALLAGVGEELLFRGTIELALERYHLWGGMILANLLFGLAHSLSWQYFVFATVIGVYLSWLSGFPGERNLLPAILAHGLYDFAAFLLIRREVRVASSETTAEFSSLPVPPSAPAPGEGADDGH